MRSFTNVNPSVFDPTKYSAFAVDSMTSCGGCDNTPADIANIAADKTAIASFFDAGRGILGPAAAADASGYAYVPDSAGNPTPIYFSSGFVDTALDTSLGIPAVNGDATHDIFDAPGTGGVSPLYGVTEIYNGTDRSLDGSAVTLALSGGKITCAGTHCKTTSTSPVPEPGTLSLFGAGLIGLAAMTRRRRKAGLSTGWLPDRRPVPGPSSHAGGPGFFPYYVETTIS